MFFDLMVSYALALVLTLLFVFSPRRRELPEGASVVFFFVAILDSLGLLVFVRPPILRARHQETSISL